MQEIWIYIEKMKKYIDLEIQKSDFLRNKKVKTYFNKSKCFIALCVI